MNNEIKKKEILFLSVLIFLIIVIRLQTITLPLNDEEGFYAYTAYKIINNKEIPYKDILTHKQPFIFYIYTTCFNIFDKNVLSIRIFSMLAIIFVSILLYIFIRTYYNSFMAFLGVILYIFYQNNIIYNTLFNVGEIYIQFILLIIFLFVFDTDEEYKNVNYFVIGFFTGILIYIKLTTLFLFLPPIFYILKFEKKDKYKYILYFLSGFISMNILVFFWALKNKIINQFYYQSFAYNFKLIKNNFLINFDIKNIINFIKINFLLIISFLYALVKTLKNKFYFLMFLYIIFLFTGIMLFKIENTNNISTLILILIILFSYIIYEMYKKYKQIKIFKIGFYLFLSLMFLYYFFIFNFFKLNKYIEYKYEKNYEISYFSNYINLQNIKYKKIFIKDKKRQIYFLTKTKMFFIEKINDINNFLLINKPYYIIVLKNNYKSIADIIKKWYKKEKEGKYYILYKYLK